MALTIGLEPTTNRLTADCSAIELSERINHTDVPCMEYITYYEIFLQDNFSFFLKVSSLAAPKQKRCP